jgi:hypothetical protein
MPRPVLTFFVIAIPLLVHCDSAVRMDVNLNQLGEQIGNHPKRRELMFDKNTTNFSDLVRQFDGGNDFDSPTEPKDLGSSIGFTGEKRESSRRRIVASGDSTDKAKAPAFWASAWRFKAVARPGPGQAYQPPLPPESQPQPRIQLQKPRPVLTFFMSVTPLFNCDSAAAGMLTLIVMVSKRVSIS